MNNMSDDTRKPWTFDREDDGFLSLSSAVFQALGAASTCWESMADAGTFDDVRARQIGDALLEELDQHITPPDHLWQVTSRVAPPDGVEGSDGTLAPAISIELGNQMRKALRLPDGVDVDDATVMHLVARAMINVGTSVLGADWGNDD